MTNGATSADFPAYRYLRTPVPLHFPSEEEVPESAVHLRVRTALYLVLDAKLKGRAYVGSDQFVYWDPTNPKLCLAPDAFVRLGGPFTLPPSFKTWEHGAPQLAVEIFSSIDVRDRNVNTRLARYRQSGIAEVLFFDGERQNPPLRIFDAVEGDLVERDLSDPAGRLCKTLGAFWCLVPDDELGLLLRLADDPEGTKIWLTPAEAAEARVQELEAELARRG
jgi:Uma2 family endonuclease